MNDNEDSNSVVLSLSCCEIELLLDSYLDSEMDVSLRERFEKHLNSCTECMSLVLECEQIMELARTLGDKPIPDDIRTRLKSYLEEEAGVKFSTPPILRIVDDN